MKRLITILIGILITNLNGAGQTMTQTIRGTVIDKDSKQPIEFANISLLQSKPNIGSSTDENGYFEIRNIKTGRQSIGISMVGFKSQIVSDIQLNSAKEVILTIEMEEEIIKLSEVIVSANNSKLNTNNDMVGVSGRKFSISEANRFAGSQNDPARMARNYAGVSGATDQRNDIIIRGNAPQGLLWKIEGIPVPNPNHFSGQGSTGGPISIINYKILSNSDFLTGAFPAEYGNATSGVFDIKMRNGNNKKMEKTIQVGALGLEAILEGPIGPKNRSSYLVGYRYSTLSILANAGVKLGFASIPYYQDATFNLNITTKKVGIIKIFGFGGISNTVFYDNKRDSLQFSPANRGENVAFGSKTGVLGMSHNYFLGNNTFIKTTIAATYEGNQNMRDSIQNNGSLKQTGGFEFSSKKTVITSFINKKINAKHTLQVGVLYENTNYQTKDSLLIYKQVSDNSFWGYNNDFGGNSALLQSYLQWKWKPNNRFTINSGIHYQILTLTSDRVLEPRLAINYRLNDRHTLSFGYGLHHQIQPYAIYFFKNINSNNTQIQTNRNLDFTRSNHLIIGYDISLNTDFRLKVETYWQYLSSVPVEKQPSSYSVLNYGATFNNTYKENLINAGKGQNIGIEFTLEKFFSKNYYFLLTTSIYNSTYAGSDNIWRNTAFNGNYVVNGLTGFEQKLKKNYTIIIDAKFTVAGGLRYSPIDIEASKKAMEAVYSNEKVFTEQNKTYLKPDLKLTLRKDFKRQIALEWALDIQNIINYQNVYLNWYDKNTQTEHSVYQNGRFPTVQLKIEF